MKFGLSDDQLRQIREVLARHPEITEAVVFGSRAMGNYKEASDVDIALKGDVDAGLAGKVKAELEEGTALPFFFDVVAYPTIENPEMVAHIDKHGLIFWKAGSREFSLLELCDLWDTKRKPLSSSERSKIKGPYPYYGASGIVDHIDCFAFSEDTVLISEDGENLNTRKTPVAFRATGKYWVNNHAHVLRPKKEYLFPIITNYIEAADLSSFITGAVQPKLSQENLSKIRLELPVSEKEQRAIAGVLSSLDDKIDLLRRQNKTLEEIAAALWRKMFVEEADSRWQSGKLVDEMDITMGQSPPGATYNENGLGMLFYQGRTDFGFRFPEPRLYCTSPKRIAQSFDTLVSVRAPVGDVNMAMEKCCIGRGVAAVRHKKGYVSYTYYKLKSLHPEFDTFEQQGTIFGSIGKDEFNDISTLVPDEKYVAEFETQAKSMDKKIILNSRQIIDLVKFRDVLLPRLISGEVAVKP